jgi:hypothetical protein
MVHSIGEKKSGGFMAFIKGDPLLSPFFPKKDEEQFTNEPEKKKDSVGDGLGTDL